MSYKPTHFKITETRCKCGRCTGATATQQLKDEILFRLDLLRIMVNMKVTVTSGWRCAAHNAASGGSAKSYHLQGRAADITCSDMPRLFAAVDRLKNIHGLDFVEIIKYPERGFLHVAR